jgi:hypothetical protein
MRRGMIQLAWHWLMFQKNSTLAKWYQARTTAAKQRLRKVMIVALARKLLIAPAVLREDRRGPGRRRSASGRVNGL